MTPAPQTLINTTLLREWPLPVPAANGDKEVRGAVLIVGGSREMPGAVILAAEAALRAGAGKLAIATGKSVAQLVALAIPESRVIGLPETDDGGFTAAGADKLQGVIDQADSVLLGPGMQDEANSGEFFTAIVGRLSHTKLVLDACAMCLGRESNGQPSALASFDQPILLTPHAGEMAYLTGATKEAILADPVAAAIDASVRWKAIVALKGSTTFIASPDGKLWRHEGGNIGLAISGSGDTLAGVIAGLAARGASLVQAAAWGVFLHARAGESLAQRSGTLGYLARELAAEIPATMRALSS